MGTGVYASTTEGQLTTARKHGVGDGWEPKAPKLHPCGAGDTLTMGLPDTFDPAVDGVRPGSGFGLASLWVGTCFRW